MLRSKLFSIFKNFQAMRYVCRYIVHYLKKFDLTISDHNRGEFHSFVYLMREAEWKILLEKYKDFEVSNIDNNFSNIVNVKYSWNGVDLGTEDLPWFLRQNRYRINKMCTGAWYYYNFKYYFSNEDDMKKFIKVAKKYRYFCS